MPSTLTNTLIVLQADLEDDPGILINFAGDDDIDEALSQPAVVAISDLNRGRSIYTCFLLELLLCYELLGTTPAASRRNLIQWLNQMIVLEARNAGRDCLVKNLDGIIQPGIYQMLIQHEHSKIESILSSYSQWSSECVANGVSAGKFYAIEGSGKGLCNIVNKRFGPFL